MCLADHDPAKILGRTASGTLQLYEVSSGLGFRCSVPNTTVGHDIYESVKRGDLNGMSFGFTVDSGDDTWDYTRNVPHRRIHSISKLMDVSVVSMPAYPDTEVNARALAALVECRSIPFPRDVLEEVEDDFLRTCPSSAMREDFILQRAMIIMRRRLLLDSIL
jgi:HK97 family phage prohead protease